MIMYKQCAKCGNLEKDEPGSFHKACSKCGGLIFRKVSPRRKDVDKLKTMCKENKGVMG